MRCTILTCRLGLVLVLALVASPVRAQESNYWINSYGTRAQLLGGLVVGSIKDLSATYYNPGAMALTKDQRLVLTTDALELGVLEVEADGEEGLSLSSTQFRPSPKIFALRLRGIEALGDHDIAFSLLARYDWRFEADARKNTPGLGLPTGQDGGIVAREQVTDFRLSEGWGGLTYARNLREGVGIGATGYVAVRSQGGRTSTLISGIDSTGSGSSVTLIDDFRYTTARLLFKGGVSWDMDPTVVGITLTTPSFHVWGSGQTSVEQTGINLGEDEGSSITANNQENLAAKYQSPLSIALGLSHSFGRTSLHTTAEWFSPVGSYEFLNASSFTSQSTGDVFDLDYSTELKSVVNFGLGVEHVFNPKTQGYAALTIDRSNLTERSKISFTNWDLYHLSSGAAFYFSEIELTVGVTYTRGSGTIPLDSTRPGELPGIDLGDLNATYNRIKVLFGVSVGS